MRALTKIRGISKRILNLGGLMDDLGGYMVESTQRKIQSNITPGNAPLTRAVKKGGLTLRDRGQYMASFSHRAGSQQVTIGTNKEQGKIHNLGGEIKPKKAKALYIPAGAQTRTLMRRFGMTVSACIKGMKAAGYSIWKSRSGKALLARKDKGKPFVLFILKRSVSIPARRHLTIDTQDRTVIRERVKKWIVQR